MGVRVLRIVTNTYCPFMGLPECSKCYMKRNLMNGFIKPGKLDPSLFEKIVQDLRPDWVSIGGGEPLSDIDHTAMILSIAKKYGSRTSMTTSGYSPDRLGKLAGLLDHVQLSIGERLVSSIDESVGVLKMNGVRFGFNVLLGKKIVYSLEKYILYIINRYSPDQIVLILPRIYRLDPDTFRRYVSRIPIVLILSAKTNVPILFDCVSSKVVFGYEPEPGTEYTLLNDGRLVLCSTHPYVKSHKECPDVRYYSSILRRGNNSSP